VHHSAINATHLGIASAACQHQRCAAAALHSIEGVERAASINNLQGNSRKEQRHMQSIISTHSHSKVLQQTPLVMTGDTAQPDKAQLDLPVYGMPSPRHAAAALSPAHNAGATTGRRSIHAPLFRKQSALIDMSQSSSLEVKLFQMLL
jgi:hypothetical protein